MTARVVVRRGSYHDSVLLMRVSLALKALEGVEDAVAVMATPHNRDLLVRAGFPEGALAGAGANDLVIAVKAAGGVAEGIEARVDDLLRAAAPATGDEVRPATLSAAIPYFLGRPDRCYRGALRETMP